jgi:hypothetical protein
MSARCTLYACNSYELASVSAIATTIQCVHQNAMSAQSIHCGLQERITTNGLPVLRDKADTLTLSACTWGEGWASKMSLQRIAHYGQFAPALPGQQVTPKAYSGHSQTVYQNNGKGSQVLCLATSWRQTRNYKSWPMNHLGKLDLTTKLQHANHWHASRKQLLAI